MIHLAVSPPPIGVEFGLEKINRVTIIFNGQDFMVNALRYGFTSLVISFFDSSSIMSSFTSCGWQGNLMTLLQIFQIEPDTRKQHSM